MATHTARCCYFLWSRSGQNATLQRLKLSSCFIPFNNNTFQHRVSYGTRRTDSTQDFFQEPQVDIPVDRLSVSYSRSSGPGGQHVNKVSTKAWVRFHVLTADWIPEDVRQKIFEKNQTRINKAGELLVSSELSRSQHRNLADCIQKIANIIVEASEKPYEPTEEEIALREQRLEKRNKERLKKKKIHSELKKGRRVDFD